jgi:prepilin-type processing-associated H-X9-DG protein
MSINPYDSPLAAGQPPERAPRKMRFTLVELLIVVSLIGILIALLLPAVRTSGEAARRSQCQNNLKQIALALQAYESVYHCLPPACTVDASGRPLHSWRTLILPYLEHLPLYEKIDLSKPWDDPVNRAAYETAVAPYRCPSAAAAPRHTTYLAVVGPNSCLRAAAPRRLAEITDEHGLALMVIDVDAGHAVHWMSPTDASEQLVLSFAEAKPLSHPGGAQAAFVDGHVEFLGENIAPARLRALNSIAGNDDDLAREAR